MPTNSAIGANPALATLPVAWEVARQYRNGRLTELRRWLDVSLEDVSLEQLWDATSEYVSEGPRALADLSEWAIFDLPSREAHWIDTDSDVFWVAVLGSALAPTGLRRVRHLGDAIYAKREQLRAVLASIQERTAAVAVDMALPDLGERLESTRTWLETRVTEHESRTRAEVRASPLAPAAVEQFSESAREAWLAGEPRAILAASASVIRTTRPPPATSRVSISNLESKDLFIENSNFVEGTWREIGRHFGEAFESAESTIIANALSLKRKRRFGGAIEERILQAVAALDRSGSKATHIWTPPVWMIGLAAQGWANTFRVEVLEWSDCPEDSVYVLALPGSIRMTQYVVRGHDLSVDVVEIGDTEIAELARRGINDVAGSDLDTPEERIRNRVWIQMDEYVKVSVGKLIRVDVADLRA